MAKLGELPLPLVEALTGASEKIGAQRAMIALQGIAHEFRSHARIDGVLREETVIAVRIASVVIGVDRLVDRYNALLQERFPDIQINQIDEEPAAEVERPTKKRRP